MSLHVLRGFGKGVKFRGELTERINVEFTVEKNTGKKMKTYDRAEFLKLCEETIEEFTQSMRNTHDVGLSMVLNEYTYRCTRLPDGNSNRYRTIQAKAIVEDLRPNIYDPVEGTTIADAEVERLQRKTKLVDVKWQTENGEELIISTTRPELICACGIVVVHPDDEE